MEYTVLARRFRPQAFGEVVGQEAIAQALQNAIAAGRVAHAYLFTGARGVGKTSTARILAKTLNCSHTQGGNPCNQCDVCRAVSEGGDVDVIEIDGASNRGIDEIRTLRANVNVRPMRCPYKIYIIDEVHMLTKEAFNALLKTLEEPPPNVKFIFATTDPQKLPETILSRCQRFDFGTIETHRIRERLSEIARAEGVEVEPAAIDLVARRANGSMRDSQSLFDQLLAFGGPKVGTADVHRLLGTAPDSRLIEMVRALATRDKALVLTQLDSILTHGTQLGEFIDQLIGCTRDLMVLTAGATEASLLSVGEDARNELIELGRQWGLQSILAALQILADAKQRMKYVSYGRIAAELALVRIASLADLELLAETMALLKSGKVPAGPLVVGSGGAASAGLAMPAAAPVGVGPTVGGGPTGPGLEKKNDSAILRELTAPPGARSV
ncbi:MAG: DNA polymerase III subunit gamma/tau, partial [Planctomycetaceae bacterium]